MKNKLALYRNEFNLRSLKDNGKVDKVDVEIDGVNLKVDKVKKKRWNKKLKEPEFHALINSIKDK